MARPVSSELVLRINSAFLLVALSLTLTYAGPRTFAALILFFVVLMSWEWGRVVRRRSADSIFALQALAIVIAGALTLKNYPASAVGVIMGATWACFWLHKKAGLASDPWWSAAGVYYAGFPAIALIAIRQDPEYGFYAILYLFLVVWSADTGAFFTGRLLGGPKLAPAISPNKTWSGLIGGALAACAAGIAFALWLGRTSVPVLAGLSVILALISQGGDLGESFIKRVFGVKHSSGLIPGHGGVLDRLDGLVFAAMGAGLIAVAADPLKPGRALLIW
ncbi:MAG: phosphatidate cytidylyltransferase [Rhodomicrobium sp.]|nr:phosphatidate cytidylyltransferase [Rhodomicrobium sp.]